MKIGLDHRRGRWYALFMPTRYRIMMRDSKGPMGYACSNVYKTLAAAQKAARAMCQRDAGRFGYWAVEVKGE